MPNVQPPSTLSLASRLPPEIRQGLGAVLRAQDKYGFDVAQALNMALVKNDTLKIFQPYTASSPLKIAAAQSYSGPYANYNTTAAQSITNSTITIVNFDTKVTDSDSAVTTGATWNFKVPAGGGGLYAINAMATFIASATSATQVYLSLFKNGAELQKLLYLSNSDKNIRGMAGSSIVLLSDADTIDLRVWQNTTGALALSAVAAENYVNITRIGGSSKPFIPAVFPFDVGPWTNGTQPTYVMAQCLDVSNQATPSNAALSLPDWIPITEGSSQMIRIRNIPGLRPTVNYSVTILAI